MTLFYQFAKFNHKLKLPLLLSFFHLLGCTTNESGDGDGISKSSDATITDSLVIVYRTLPSQGAVLLQDPAGVTKGGATQAEGTIELDPETTYQTIEGFGAALTGSSAYVLIQYLDDNKRQEILKDLFDPQEGIGLSYLRMTIGASDFSSDNYSYDDPPQGEKDSDLKYFSVEQDEDDVIPVLQQIVAINPDIQLMGSPWSPPAWMKTSQKMIGGTLQPEAYESYANYFVKYIHAFQEKGIPIAAITLQNEPEFEPDSYPGMLMTPAEEAGFVKGYLGPAFEKNNMDTKILVFDHNWDNPDYPIEVLNDQEARKYVDGVAFHCYKGDVSSMAKVHQAYPDHPIYFTECSGGAWAPNFADNLKWYATNLIIGNMRNWASSVILWNLALDEKHGPTNQGCLDCRGVITVNSGTGRITKNVEYYALGHVSKFVRPGAKRISSTDLQSDIKNVAFANPDGSLVLVVLNGFQEDKKINLKTESGLLNYSLKAGSLNTFYIPATAL